MKRRDGPRTTLRRQVDPESGGILLAHIFTREEVAGARSSNRVQLYVHLTGNGDDAQYVRRPYHMHPAESG